MANTGNYLQYSWTADVLSIVLIISFLCSVVDPDGTVRTVKYTADKKNGFQAQVYTNGKMESAHVNTGSDGGESSHSHSSHENSGGGGGGEGDHSGYEVDHSLSGEASSSSEESYDHDGEDEDDDEDEDDE